jgi:colanic acid biosynthesis glycosyl transferase WcaI
MVAELARQLVAQGHAATVAAGYPHHPGGRVLGGYRTRFLLREECDGVRVVRGWHVTSESTRIPVRASVMLSQALGTGLAARSVRDGCDLVVNFGPPLIGPLLSAAVARRRGARAVTVIYDIYPDVAIETGKLRNKAGIALARWMERRVYAASDRIVVLSEGFRRTLAAKGVDPAKVDVLPVWLQPDEVRPSTRVNEWRREHGISPDTFVALYAGTIGIVSGAEMLADVAERLRAERDLLFLMVGEGQAQAALKTEAERRGLQNMRFLPLQDRTRLNEVQATADVSMVTLAPGRGRTSVPSKVVGYLAAGRPVLAAVDPTSDTAECVQGCGVVVPPGDAASFAAALLQLKRDPPRRQALGKSARDRFEEQYAGPKVISRFIRTLEILKECPP